MKCGKCGNIINSNSVFCPFCGNQIGMNTQQLSSKKIINNLNKKQKTVIVSLLGVIVLLLGIALFFQGGNTRTIMIYIVGSNLETDSKIVTAELEAIDPKKIDLTKTNILLYTGGTEKWHNFISNEENGIYILKSNGFEKLESLEKYNLGDPKTLTDFLKYGHDNYKADKYDLILYDHGGAIDGAIYDELTNDNLTLEDMSKAMKDSPFDKNNKLEAVLFRTCLNGTIELANVFKDYSNYLIASEEISYGSNCTDVLSFLNSVLPSSNGLEFGKIFVDAYDKQMEILNPYNDNVQTYSVIDLSKIDKLNKELDEYVKGIEITKNYREIVLIRNGLYQYGSASTADYDMVDLYELVNKTSEYSSKDYKKLLNLINQTVKYNKTNNKDSHGISIYFPYNAAKARKAKFLDVYENLDYSEEYKKFIKTFNNMQKSPSKYSFNVSDNESLTDTDGNGFSLALNEEQSQNYANGLFAIFEQNSEHPNYYRPIFSSDDVTLSNGVLKANINNKMVKIKDDDDGKYYYILTYYRKRNNGLRTIDGILYGKNLEITDEGYMNKVTFSIMDNNGTPFVSSAKLKSKNERIDGIMLELKNYDNYEIWNNTFKILDEDGNYTDEWEQAPVVTGFGGKLSEIELKNSNLDNDNNYYGLFILKDIYDNTSYSKLIKVGE